MHGQKRAGIEKVGIPRRNPDLDEGCQRKKQKGSGNSFVSRTLLLLAAHFVRSIWYIKDDIAFASFFPVKKYPIPP